VSTNRRLMRAPLPLLLALLLVVSLLPASAGAEGDPPDAAGDRIPGQILVKFEDGAPGRAVAEARRAAAAEELSVIEQLGVHVWRVPEHASARALEALQRNPHVEFAELDAVVELDGIVPNDPEFTNQWGLRQVNAPEAWTLSRGTSNVVIAILDTGVAPVPDLAGKLLPGRNVLTGTGDTSDGQGHGTWSAGVAAATTDNGIAVAGYCWHCSILPVKVLDGTSGTMSSLVAGITWAADNGADVISMSLSGPSGTTTLRDAVSYAAARDVALVAAAGNEGDTVERYPAAYPEVIGVAGTTSQDQLYAWSNHGDWVDVAAPGNNITTTRDGGTINYGGTSAATPAVAGVLGLALEHATATQARDALQSTAAPLPFVRFGRIDAEATLQTLGVGDPASSEPPRPDAAGPVADFSVDCVDLECDFIDSSTAGDAEVVSYSWAFGDGGTATGASASHVYTSDGTYTASLTVTDANGLADTVARDVLVSAPPTSAPQPEPEPVPDPDPEPSIELRATTTKVRGFNVADLAWSGTEVEVIDVYVNGGRLATVSNRATYRHETGLRGSPTLRYQICEAVAEGRCSDELTISSW
jgi:thermitase